MSAPILGIDFGSSATVAATVKGNPPRAEVLHIDGDESIPSVLWYAAIDSQNKLSEPVVGKHALTQLGEDRDEHSNIIVSPKRLLAQRMVFSIQHGEVVRYVTPVEAAADILRTVKRAAEQGEFSGQTITSVILTHPAVYDELERQCLRTAAEKAAFRDIHLIPEPVSALHAAVAAGRPIKQSVLVFNLGAGTFDLAWLTLDDTDWTVRELEGVRIGGSHFDERIYQHWLEQAQLQLQGAVAYSASILKDNSLLTKCRDAKEALSSQDSVTRRLEWPLSDGSTKSLKMTLARDEFRQLIHPDVLQIMNRVQKLVETARQATRPIDSVLLIGGATRTIGIKELLEQALPPSIKPDDWQASNIAVAQGAAWLSRRYIGWTDPDGVEFRIVRATKATKPFAISKTMCTCKSFAMFLDETKYVPDVERHRTALFQTTDRSAAGTLIGGAVGGLVGGAVAGLVGGIIGGLLLGRVNSTHLTRRDVESTWKTLSPHEFDTAIFISRGDITKYLEWRSIKFGRTYTLPTAAEINSINREMSNLFLQSNTFCHSLDQGIWQTVSGLWTQVEIRMFDKSFLPHFPRLDTNSDKFDQDVWGFAGFYVTTRPY